MLKIEAVCRVMCEADGDDPDRETWVVGDPDRERRIGGGDVVDAPRGSAWENYEPMARRFMAAYAAMDWIE